MNSSNMQSFFKQSLKILGLLFIFFVMGTAALLLMLPTLASTDWGKRQLVAIINERIPGTVEVKSLNLSWLNHQAVSGVELKDPLGRSILHFDSLSTDSSLIDLLRYRLSKGSAKLVGLDATIVEEESGVTNVQKAIGIIPDTSGSHNPSKIIASAINLSDVNGELHLAAVSEPMVLQLKGITKQGDIVGHFAIDASYSGIDIEKCLQTGRNNVLQECKGDLKVEITNFPVALIDEILAIRHPELNGMARAILGSTLDLSIEKSIADSEVFFAVKASSATLSAGLSGQIKEGILFLTRPGRGSLMVTPDLVNFLVALQKDFPPLHLQNSVKAQLGVDQLKLPLAFFTDNVDSPLSAEEMAISAQVSLDHADLTGDKAVGSIVLQQMKATIQAPENLKIAIIQVKGEVLRNGQPFQIYLNATVDKPNRLKTLFESVRQKPNSEMHLSVNSNNFDLKADLKGNPLNQMNCLAELAIHPQDRESLFATTIGNTAHVAFDSMLSYAGSGVWDLTKVQAELTSDIIHARLFGHTIGKQFYMTQPARVQYTLDPMMLKKLGLNSDEFLHLTKPTQLALTVNPLKAPLQIEQLAELDFSDLHLSGLLSLEELPLDHPRTSFNPDIFIKKMTIPWEIDASDNRIKLDISTATQFIGNTPGDIKAQVMITDWLKGKNIDLYSAGIVARVNIDKFPIAVLEAISERKDLVDFLGTTMDIRIDANLRELAKRQGTLIIAFQGEALQTTAALKMDDIITLQDPLKPIVVNATLTPRRFHLIRNMLRSSTADTEIAQDNVVLLEPTKVVATVHSLSIPWPSFSESSSQQLLSQIGMTADLFIDNLKVTDQRRKQSMSFENIISHFDSIALAKKVVFHVNAREKQTSGGGNDLILTGTLENIFTEAGDFNKDDLSLNLEARSKQLPASLLCQIACLEETFRNKVEALLGHAIDTDIKVHLHHMNGPVQATLQGSNGNIKIDALLTNGVLTLAQPLKMAIAVTPQLGKSILQELFPILSGVIAAENPVRIQIDPEGFSFPLQSLDLNKIQIGHAFIDMGKMTFSNEGQLGMVFELLRPSAHEDLTVWFTPLYFTMQDGVLKVKRMDMLLLNRYPLAIWGKVDVIKDKVDLRIGLTGTALSYALNLHGLDKDYMMQLPLKGKMGDASIDKGKATARISALVAQSQGGAQGLLIGTFLEIAGGGLSEEHPPALTTNPLPWENVDNRTDKTNQGNTTDNDKDTSSNYKPKSIEKRLQEGATSVIKNFFG